MDRDKYRLIYRKYRRSFEKRFGGYTTELSLSVRYIITEKQAPQNKFIIFGYQRTGSTLLVDLLNSHPLIECDGELLLNRMFNPDRYLCRRAKLSKADNFGFKLLTPHFDYQNINQPDHFIQGLVGSGYKVIKLKRLNILRTAISLIYAINSGKFHFQRSSLNKAAPKIYIDLSELIEKIQWIEYSISVQEQAIFDIPHLEVIYEDDLVDPSRHQETVKRISNYLGIHNELVQTKWVKYSDDLSQTITNVDEIKSFIQNTKYSEFLDF